MIRLYIASIAIGGLQFSKISCGLVCFWFCPQQPNDEDPLNHEAAAVLRDNPKLFEANVKRAMAGGYVGQHYFPRCAWYGAGCHKH